MLSKRPSTFDRSESRSNGAARPWSTLLDLLLQWKKNANVNKTWIMWWISFHNLFIHSTTLQYLFLSLANVNDSCMRLLFRMCNCRRLLTSEPFAVSIGAVSWKTRNEKKEFSAVSIYVHWPSWLDADVVLELNRNEIYRIKKLQFFLLKALTTFHRAAAEPPSNENVLT